MSTSEKGRLLSKLRSIVRGECISQQKKDGICLLLCFFKVDEENNHYTWHFFDPLNRAAKDREFGSTINLNRAANYREIEDRHFAPMINLAGPMKDLTSGFSTTVYDGKLYIIGGFQTIDFNRFSFMEDNVYHVPSSHVMMYNFKQARWEKGVSMTGARVGPIVAASHNNVFALGSFNTQFPTEPWGEVYDTSTQIWSDLPYPHDNVVSAEDLAHVFIEKQSAFLLSYSHGDGHMDMCKYDSMNKNWKEFTAPDKRLVDIFSRLDTVKVVVHSILFMFSDGKLYGCHIESREKKVVDFEVEGLEEATKSIDTECTPIFLFYLGEGTLCLLWWERVSFMQQLIRSLKINLFTFKLDEDSFTVESQLFLDCIPVRRSTFMGPAFRRIDAVSGNAAGNPEIFLSQDKRHAERVYIGNLPFSADKELVACFFNEVLVKIGARGVVKFGTHFLPLEGDPVRDVYINGQKHFAILHMASAELASNTMALDGILFQNTRLSIRRPSDYNPGLAAGIGRTQPSCYLNLDAAGSRQCDSESLCSKLRRTVQTLAFEISLSLSKGLYTHKTQVICLHKAVYVGSVQSKRGYETLLKYFKGVAEEYGPAQVCIPLDAKAIGRVFFKYGNSELATQALRVLNGNFLDEYRVIGFYYPLDKYDNSDFTYLLDYFDYNYNFGEKYGTISG